MPIRKKSIEHNKRILDGITNPKDKADYIKYYTMVIWFYLLAKAKTMQKDVFKEFSDDILNYWKNIDTKLDTDKVKQTLFPMNINTYTGEVREQKYV